MTRRLVVLQMLAPPDGTTKYADLLAAAKPVDTHFRWFSWSRALFGRYDVLHTHWPELRIRDSRRPWMRVVKRRMMDLLLLRLRLTRTPLVWTAHNLAPHEAAGAAEKRSLRRFTAHVDLALPLTHASPVQVGREQVVVPHSHYREAFAAHRASQRVPGRILHFGIIRPYKGVDVLLRAFDGVTRPGAGLRIVGHPHPGQDGPVLAACAADERITAVLRYVDDGELVAEVSAAQLVVLPYQGVMHNSGALVAALSLATPVLVPRSRTNEVFAERVGSRWVIQYDGDLTTEVLEDALEQTASDADELPRLDDHDPRVVGELHRAAYVRALDLKGRAWP